jgi:hypothetical protein
MMTTGEAYLAQLAGFPPTTFPGRFARIAASLHLGTALDHAELKCLYEAAFQATLCNIAFNGLGGCGGKIKPEHEPNRIRLEREFMATSGQLYASAGWQALPPFVRHPIREILLSVSVTEHNLAAP